MGKNRVDAGRGGGAGVVKKTPAVRKKDNRPFYALLALIAVAGIGAIAWFATRPKASGVTSVDPAVVLRDE